MKWGGVGWGGGGLGFKAMREPRARRRPGPVAATNAPPPKGAITRPHTSPRPQFMLIDEEVTLRGNVTPAQMAVDLAAAKGDKIKA